MKKILFILLIVLGNCLTSRAAIVWDDYWYKDMSGIAPKPVPKTVTHGQTLLIDCTENALRNAINTLNNAGGIIRFKHNNSNQTILLNQSIEFIGNNKIFLVDGEGFVTIDGQNKTGLFVANDYVKLIFQNITLTRGRGIVGSGLALENRVGLIAINVTFTDNHNSGTADINGGGAVKMNKQSSGCFANCKFINNSAWTGGAIGATHQEILIVLDCEFTGNRSIALWDGISNPLIWETGGVVTGITGGGAIRCDNLFNICEVYRSTFDNNSSTANASALEVYVNRNHEWRDGLNRPSCIVDSCTFKNNGLDANTNQYSATTPYTYQGVVQHFYGGKIIIRNSSFLNNSTADGTLVIPDSRAETYNCLIANNTVLQKSYARSAGFYTQNSGEGNSISIDRTTFYNNIGKESGAFFASSKRVKDINITNSLFVNNTSSLNTKTSNLTYNGSNNIQWPNLVNSSDLPITTGVRFANPLIQKIDATGFPPKLLLANNSPSIGIGSDSYILTNTIERESNNTVLVFPNPTSDFLIVNIPEEWNTSKISIFDINGKVVTQMQNISGVEYKVPVHVLTKGIYLIQIESNNRTSSTRFIKQ